MRRFLVTLALLAGVAFAGFFAVTWLTAALATPVALNPCPEATPVKVGTIVVPRGPVAGYCQPELVNAAKVMSAAKDMGIGTRTQTIGVMTAIGESGLRNLDYGDAAGPDSRGLFQQRDNGAWGTLEERMDPYTAAHRFFVKATKVPGWKTMEPTALAHAVQRNSDPNHYAKYWGRAQQVVAALTPPAPTATKTPGT